jgi:hypothetical protein
VPFRRIGLASRRQFGSECLRSAAAAADVALHHFYRRLGPLDGSGAGMGHDSSLTRRREKWRIAPGAAKPAPQQYASWHCRCLTTSQNPRAGFTALRRVNEKRHVQTFVSLLARSVYLHIERLRGAGLRSRRPVLMEGFANAQGRCRRGMSFSLDMELDHELQDERSDGHRAAQGDKP